MTGRATKDETAQVLALVANLAALTEAIAQLRETQQRAAQASAARTAAHHLATAGYRILPARSVAAGIHRSAGLAPVHRSPAAPGPSPAARRKVSP